AFVIKLNATGTATIYSNRFGALNGGNDQANAIAVDAAGNAYVAGHTVGHSNWGDFPTVKPLQSPGSGGAFVTKFDPAGAMVYSTTLGGSGRSDWATGIAVDSLGDMYVSGSTSATDFPTSHPLQATLKGGTDA